MPRMAATLPTRGEASVVTIPNGDVSMKVSTEGDRNKSGAPGLVCRGGIAGGACSIVTESLCDVIIGGLGGLGVVGRDGDDLDV